MPENISGGDSHVNKDTRSKLKLKGWWNTILRNVNAQWNMDKPKYWPLGLCSQLGHLPPSQRTSIVYLIYMVAEENFPLTSVFWHMCMYHGSSIPKEIKINIINICLGQNIKARVQCFLSVLSEVGSLYVVYRENIKIDLHFTISFFQLQGKSHESRNKCKKVAGHVGTCSSGSLKLGGAQASGRKSKERHYLWQDIDRMWNIKRKRGHRKCLCFQLPHLFCSMLIKLNFRNR